jgi:hypothetical protein
MRYGSYGKRRMACKQGWGKPSPYNTRLVALALYFIFEALVTILAVVSCVLLQGQLLSPQQPGHLCPVQ